MVDLAQRPLGMDEESWRRLLAQAPSRFALCLEREDDTLGEIVGWGMASAGDAVVVPLGGGLANRFSSVDKALWIHGAALPIQLAWIDEPVDEPVDGPIEEPADALTGEPRES